MRWSWYFWRRNPCLPCASIHILETYTSSILRILPFFSHLARHPGSILKSSCQSSAFKPVRIQPDQSSAFNEREAVARGRGLVVTKAMRDCKFLKTLAISVDAKIAAVKSGRHFLINQRAFLEQKFVQSPSSFWLPMSKCCPSSQMEMHQCNSMDMWNIPPNKWD